MKERLKPNLVAHIRRTVASGKSVGETLVTMTTHVEESTALTVLEADYDGKGERSFLEFSESQRKEARVFVLSRKMGMERISRIYALDPTEHEFQVWYTAQGQNNSTLLVETVVRDKKDLAGTMAFNGEKRGLLPNLSRRADRLLMIGNSCVWKMFLSNPQLDAIGEFFCEAIPSIHARRGIVIRTLAATKRDGPVGEIPKQVKATGVPDVNIEALARWFIGKF